MMKQQHTNVEVSSMAQLTVGLDVTILSMEVVAVVVCFECSVAHLYLCCWKESEAQEAQVIFIFFGW